MRPAAAGGPPTPEPCCSRPSPGKTSPLAKQNKCVYLRQGHAGHATVWTGNRCYSFYSRAKLASGVGTISDGNKEDTNVSPRGHSACSCAAQKGSNPSELRSELFVVHRTQLCFPFVGKEHFWSMLWGYANNVLAMFREKEHLCSQEQNTTCLLKQIKSAQEQRTQNQKEICKRQRNVPVSLGTFVILERNHHSKLCSSLKSKTLLCVGYAHLPLVEC